jgi:hypothetical protein
LPNDIIGYFKGKGQLKMEGNLDQLEIAIKALIEAMGMMAENQRAIQVGQTPPYGENAFLNLHCKYDL